MFEDPSAVAPCGPLGLSIVKHIIEAHQEQIYVKSKVGIGTEFSFTLLKP